MVCVSGASMASTFAYQSFRGLMRSFAGASAVSRSMSKVTLTSREVNGWPSCHFTPLRRKNTRFRKLSCHDHFSASSPMIVSTLSVFLRGSKSTRLLRHGIAGQTVEIVAVSWMANPCGRSSRSIRLRTPPDLGGWLVARIAARDERLAKLPFPAGCLLDGAAGHDAAERQRQLARDVRAVDDDDAAAELEEAVHRARHGLGTPAERDDIEVGADRRGEAVEPRGEARDDPGGHPPPTAVQEGRADVARAERTLLEPADHRAH